MKSMLFATVASLSLVGSCRTSNFLGDAGSTEFEGMEDICASVKAASDHRFDPAKDASRMGVFLKIKTQELAILDRLLVAYRARVTNLAASMATPEQQSDLDDAGAPSSKDLETTVVDDQNVCQQCTIEEAREWLEFYALQTTSLQSCQLSESADNLASNKIDWRKALVDFLSGEVTREDICKVSAKLAVQAAPASCKNSAVKAACAEYFSSEPERDAKGVQVPTGIQPDVREAVLMCVNESAGPEVADAAVAALDAASKAKAEGKDLRTIAGLAACEGAAKYLSHKTAEVPKVNYENSCGALNPFQASDGGKSRAVSCLRSARDVCEIFMDPGNPYLDELIPTTDASPSLLQSIVKVAKTGLNDKVCQVDAQTKLACSVIGKSALQIRDAVTKGNNDWAHCIGSDQLGACLGTLWAQQGWSNSGGVEMASGTGDNQYRGCCWCQLDSYVDDGWVTDTKIGSENWFGVIQSGDVKSGNCTFNESVVVAATSVSAKYKDRQTYAKYRSCGKWYVRGDRCALPPGSFHQVWDGKDRRWFKVNVP